MIGSLRGIVRQRVGPAVLLEVSGVGYLVHAPLREQAETSVGDEKAYYIYDYIREDARKLFGFTSLDERSFFETLISISGVGPKVALLILSIGPLDEIRRAVEKEDLHMLTSLPGVGAKTAQKILLELKGKIVRDDVVDPADRDVLGALASLGYAPAQAREAVRGIDPSVRDTQERIRAALKALSS